MKLSLRLRKIAELQRQLPHLTSAARVAEVRRWIAEYSRMTDATFDALAAAGRAVRQGARPGGAVRP